jgi:deazaflavin-dependent oxidoreductase (nitroreductase family)
MESAFVPVGPAPVVRIVMGPMTKVFNPIIGRFAGRRRSRLVAQLHHVGRRSGRPFVTSVAAERIGDSIVIPLTFGNQSDWARNVRAAGRCAARIKGVDYDLVQPEFVPISIVRSEIRALFGPAQRFMFRLTGIKQVLRLRIVDDASA